MGYLFNFEIFKGIFVIYDGNDFRISEIDQIWTTLFRYYYITIMQNCYRHCKKRVANATILFGAVFKKKVPSLFFSIT